MASFNNGSDIDWLWGSLKPWQILHSTLAEKERCGSVQVDVWELVNETLGASTTDLASEEEQGRDRGRSHGIQFLEDDGDFWRHGGVMESRVREWLARKAEEDHHHHHLLHHHKCTSSTELAIASCSTIDQRPAAISIAWEAASASDSDYDDQSSCSEDAAAAAADDDDDQEGESEHAEDAEDSTDIINVDDQDEALDEEEDNYSVLISSNYRANEDYDEISREVFVVNQCCRGGVGGAGGAGGDQEGELQGETAGELEEPPELEEGEEAAYSVEVCAVCLEKLNEEGGVQALACRHAFHTACISPWLQRQPHACCPCCRAPAVISTANYSPTPPPLHLEAPPLHLAASRDLHAASYSCAPGLPERRIIGHDIMRLLADMEAALEHLGFRS